VDSTVYAPVEESYSQWVPAKMELCHRHLSSTSSGKRLAPQPGTSESVARIVPLPEILAVEIVMICGPILIQCWVVASRILRPRCWSQGTRTHVTWDWCHQGKGSILDVFRTWWW